MNTGSLVRHHRDAAGLTQGELAARAGLSQGALSAIERGSRRPGIGTLERVLAGLGLELRISAVDPMPAIDAAIDAAAGRSAVDRLRGHDFYGAEMLGHLAPARPAVEGLAGAALHGAPVPVGRLEAVVARDRLGDLHQALVRLGADRWSNRWKQWGMEHLDPRRPGAMRWLTSSGELGVRIVDEMPETVAVVVSDDLTVAVRPLHEIECADPAAARVLGRLRERWAAAAAAET